MPFFSNGMWFVPVHSLLCCELFGSFRGTTPVKKAPQLQKPQAFHISVAELDEVHNKNFHAELQQLPWKPLEVRAVN